MRDVFLPCIYLEWRSYNLRSFKLGFLGWESPPAQIPLDRVGFDVGLGSVGVGSN